MLDVQAMKNVDVRTVDPVTLADGNDVKIKTELPKQERMLDYIRQIGNPYCYRFGKMVVKVGHAATGVTLDDRMEHYLSTL